MLTLFSPFSITSHTIDILTSLSRPLLVSYIIVLSLSVTPSCPSMRTISARRTPTHPLRSQNCRATRWISHNADR